MVEFIKLLFLDIIIICTFSVGILFLDLILICFDLASFM